MKYEIELKVKESQSKYATFYSKWKQICNSEERLQHVKKAFEEAIKQYHVVDYVILINKLDDSGNFIEIIQ